MDTSRLQPALFISVLLHLLLLVSLRLMPLPRLNAPPELQADIPVAVQLLDVPPPVDQPSRPAASRPQALPKIPDRVRPSQALKAPPTLPAPAPRAPKLNTPPPPPRKGGTVVDIPKPVREERPDEARLISRYDSKAQDLGPGAGGTRKPSGAQPRTAPPEIPLPERYSKGQPTPPNASLMPTTPVTPTPPSSVTTPTPRPPISSPTGADAPPPRPPTSGPPSETLTPPLPPAPIPRTKPAPPARRIAPVLPRVQPEDKRSSIAALPAPSRQASSTTPSVPAPPRPARAAKRRPAPPPEAVAPPAQAAAPQPASPPSASPGQRRAAAPPAIPPPPGAPGRPMTPEELRRYRLTAQQELEMMQRDSLGQPGAGTPPGQKQQALEEHFASLEKHQPLPSFDGPGVYERGPERSGEGGGTGEGGKYRSIASFGFKHVSYLYGMQRKIQLVFSIPPLIPDQGAVGVPIVGFTVRRNGELAETVLLRSSGYPAVDRALMRAVRRAAPYRPFPADMPDQEISIRVFATPS